MRGVPKPFSTQCRESTFIRSMSGLRMNVSGSTGGSDGLVNPISGLLGDAGGRFVRAPKLGSTHAAPQVAEGRKVTRSGHAGTRGSPRSFPGHEPDEAGGDAHARSC